MNRFVIKKATIVLFVIAVLFLAIGIKNGEFNDVFRKAHLICLECIGIG